MIKESTEQITWRKEFEKMPNTHVRLLAETDPSVFEQSSKSLFAKVWLAEQDAAKRDLREEETLSIARQARSDARFANKIAISAAIFATAATIIAAWLAVK